MGKTFTWLDFFMESEADLQACMDDMLSLEGQPVLKSPSDESLSKILDFAEVYEAVEIDCVGITEFYKN